MTDEFQYSVDLSAALATSVMPAPWLEILQSGWPIFPLLAILSRWASPHMDFTGAAFSGPNGRKASEHAIIDSACDQAEFGAMQRARRVLGVHWRDLDPTVQSSDLDQIEVALAELQGSSRREDRFAKGTGTYQCYWTHHPNRTLGGKINEIEENEEINAGNALGACAAVETCAGILENSLRIGEPFLQESVGEVSHVRWCTPRIFRVRTALLCPFARAVGLLGSAFRLLSNLGKIKETSWDLFQTEMDRTVNTVGL